MVKKMKTTLTEKINWTKYNLAYPELGDVITDDSHGRHAIA